MSELKRFGDFDLCCSSDGEPIELMKLDTEFVFLAFDAQLNKLVQLHLLRSGLDRPSNAKTSQDVLTKLDEIASHDHGYCLPVLKRGVQDGLVFYSTPVTHSEPASEFVKRLGSLPLPTALVLSLHLCNELLAIKDKSGVFYTLGLEDPEIYLWEDACLQLLITDYQLEAAQNPLAIARKEPQMVQWVCRLLFLLLTARPYQNDDIESIPVLTALPTGLRLAFKQNLRNVHPEASLQGFRDELKTTVVHYTRAMQYSQQRRYLMAHEIGLPSDCLVSTLPTASQMDTLQRTFEFVQRESLFTEVVARHRATGAMYKLSLTQVCDFDVNVGGDEAWVVRPVRGMGTLQWSASECEENHTLNLGRLVGERGHLNAVEIFQIMEKIAESVGADPQRRSEDLYPYKIILDTGHPVTGRDLDRLIQRRVDAWGGFKVHMTKKRTVKDFVYPGFFAKFALESKEAATAANFMEHFVYLALYMATGVSQFSTQLAFPTELKVEVKEFLLKSLYSTDSMTVDSFVKAFKDLLYDLKLLQDTEVELVPKKSGIKLERMKSQTEQVDYGNYENAGSVSDYDSDYLEQEDEVYHETSFVGSVKASISGFVQKWFGR